MPPTPPYFISYFITLHVILQLGLVESKAIVNCEYLNRHNSDTADECGPCLPGFITHSVNGDACIALGLLTISPSVVKGVFGGTIELLCTFNEIIQCAWERNGSLGNVDNNTRYRFKDQGVSELTFTRQCTLIIQSLRAIDVGPWRCGSKATSDTESVKSHLIHIDLTPVVRGQPEPWLPMTFSHNLTLLCTFDQPVVCDWKRKRHQQFEAVSIEDHYEYTEETIGPKANCSIRIKGLREEDQGVWECEGKVLNTNYSMTSKHCVVTGSYKRNLVHVLMEGEVVDGHVLQLRNISQLECVSDDVMGQLQWAIDGQPISQSAAKSIKLHATLLEASLRERSWVILSCRLISPFNRTRVILTITNNKDAEIGLMVAGNDATAALVFKVLFGVCMAGFIATIIGLGIHRIRNKKSPEEETRDEKRSTEVGEEQEMLPLTDIATTAE